MAFFEYCVKCQQMFVSEATWNEHRAWHENRKQVKNKKPFAEAEQKTVLETAAEIPGADPAEIEDVRVARTKDVRSIKKELKKAGIECQTMTADEAKDAYEKAKKEGRIKDAERS